QTPADIVFLSFSDSDLAGMAAAWESRKDELPSLRLASLASLRHPFSVDRYVETVISRARIVLVPLLGGRDCWRYGAEELARAAREYGVAIAFVPGDAREDARLDALSTLPKDKLDLIFACLHNGGAGNIGELLVALGAEIEGRPWQAEPRMVPA